MVNVITVVIKNPNDLGRIKRVISQLLRSPNKLVKELSDLSAKRLREEANIHGLVDKGYLTKHIRSVRKGKGRYGVQMPRYGEMVSQFKGAKVRKMYIPKDSHFREWADKHGKAGVKSLWVKEHPFIQYAMDPKSFKKVGAKAITKRINDIIKRYK